MTPPVNSLSIQKAEETSQTNEAQNSAHVVASAKKRNGDVEVFSADKLSASIFRALSAAGAKKNADDSARRITRQILTRLNHIFAGKKTPTTTEISAIVEESLIDFNLTHVLKRYLSYRLLSDAERISKGPIYGKGITVRRYFTKHGKHPFDEIEWERRTARITNEKGEAVFEQKDVEVPRFWSQTATNIVVQKYFVGKLGAPNRETSVKQLVGRVVGTIADWGRKDGYFAASEDADAFEAELTHILVNQKAAFNSPVWFNLGVPDRLPQASACFINSVQDDMRSILQLAFTEGMLFKYGSGTGSNLSTLRSSRENLAGSPNKSSGPVSFMKAYDALAGVVKSGGKTRRAAKMVILNAEHPDIMDFIWCKVKEEKKAWALMDAGYDGSMTGEAYASIFYQNANNSVRVTDEFMQAVLEDKEWWTRYVITGEPCEKYRARDIMRAVAEAAWECGDPGLQTDTTINKWHTTKNTGRINASNPCVTGDTLISTKEGYRRIADLVGKSVEVIAGDGKASSVSKIWKTGHKPVYELRTKSGYTLKLTAEHKINTANRGDVPAHELRGGDVLLVERDFNPKVIAHRLEAVGGISSIATFKQEFYASNVAIRESVKLKVDFVTDEFVDLTYAGEEDVYDIEEPRTHHFVANGLVVHNCSEYMYLDDTACNLASLNLMKYRKEDGDFDVPAFKHAAEIVITAMEIIVGNASYPTPAIEQNSYDHRPLGIGYANLGALAMARGLPYDSDSARNLAGAITSLMSGACYAQSARIAEKMGPFAAFPENKASMLGVMKMHRDAAYKIAEDEVEPDLLEAARKSWDEVLELGEKHGIRNSQISVTAPTGTIAFLMDCDTTGIEPDIALVKYKWLVGGGMLKIVNNIVPEALARLGYSGDEIDDIIAFINEHDTIEGAPGLKEEHLAVFDCAFKPQKGKRTIHWRGHVKMMAAVQPFISGAISKTINMPQEAAVEEIMNVYIESWKLGLKAMAVYRDGSKRQQALTTSLDKDQKKKSAAAAEIAGPRRRRLPDERRSITHKFSIGGHEGYITVGLYDDGAPGELFITMSKEGSVISGLMDSFATSISIALQYGVPLKTLANKFVHMRFEPSGFTGHPNIKIAKSVVDYVFRWLAMKFLSTEEQRAMGIRAQETGETSSAEAAATSGDIAAAPASPAQQNIFSAAEAAAEAKAESELAHLTATFDNTSDAPVCTTCGSIMVRYAACYRCLNCGDTSGCS